MNSLETLLDELAERVAARVAERLRAGSPEAIDQSRSPLGRRRHCHAVRRRLAAGLPGASVIGRRHLLAPEALSEELARTGGAAPKQAHPGNSVRAELERELRMVKGGR